MEMFGISKEVWGIAATVLAFANYAPLFWAVYQGKSKPHMFSYIIWTLITAIAWGAQWVEGAGPGAWTTLMSTALCGVALVLSIRYGHRDITRLDWVFLLAGLMIIPVWVLTENALYAACMAATIDACGYLPTFRKSWMRPHEENARQYVFANVKWIAAFMAMASVTPATMIFPLTAFSCNTLLLVQLMVRRRMLGLHP